MFDLFQADSPGAMVSANSSLKADPELKATLEALVHEVCDLTQSAQGLFVIQDVWGAPSLLISNNDRFENMDVPAKTFLRLIAANIHPNSPVVLNEISPQVLQAGITFDIKRAVGVPVLQRGQLLGRLVVFDKSDPYSEYDLRIATHFAKMISLEVEVSELSRRVSQDEQWIETSQGVTQALFDATDDEGLEPVVSAIKNGLQVDTVLVILPSVAGTWACEFASGHMAEELLGAVFPEGGRALFVISEKAGMIVESFDSALNVKLAPLRHFGPALYAPLMNRNEAVGVLVLLRKKGAMPFDMPDLRFAESVSLQAAFGLEIFEARHIIEMTALANERERISADLHDFAIQELFAAGIQITAAKNELEKINAPDDAKQYLDGALDAIDNSVVQVRSIVQNLKDDVEGTNVFERICQVTSAARRSLGFAPSCLLNIDGRAVTDVQDPVVEQALSLFGDELASDITAFVREGLSNVARHAQADVVTVNIDLKTQGEPQIDIEIEDDGIGIDPNRTRNSGLANLDKRVKKHGGTMSIDKRTDKGTTLKCELPIA
nr:GAF domain-containing protein [Gleimia europaea]